LVFAFVHLSFICYVYNCPQLLSGIVRYLTTKNLQIDILHWSCWTAV